MNMISFGNFDGFETPAGFFSDTDAKDAEGFDMILENIAGLMQTTPVVTPVVQAVVAPATVQPAVTVTPKGWNPEIEKIKAQLGIESGPTAVNPDSQELWQGTAPIVANPHIKTEINFTRLPTRLPDVPPTPPIIVPPPSADDSKKSPVVTQSPDIIVLPTKDPGKQPPVVTQSPDIIVLPTKDPAKQPPVVAQSPDIIVPPTKDPVKQPPVVTQSPDIIVLPTKGPVKQPPVVEQSPDIIVPPTTPPVRHLPTIAIENRKADAHLSLEGLINREFGADGLINPLKPKNAGVIIAPTSVNEADGIDQAFDPSRVVLHPQFDAGRLSGFSVTPNDVDTLVRSFSPVTAAPATEIKTADVSVMSAVNDAAPRFNEISAAIRAAVTPTATTETSAASNLSRFWMSPSATRATQKPEGSVASIGPTSKPVEARVSGTSDTLNAFDPTRESIFERLTTSDAKPVAEVTLSTPASERVDDQLADSSRADDNGQPLKFENFMANAAKELAKTSDARTEPAATKVTEQVNPHLLELAAMANRKQEKQSLKLRLHPAELGSVEIRLERADSGAINAFFTTETDGARQALNQNMDQLRESLRQSGWHVGQMEVANGGPSDSGRQQRESASRAGVAFNESVNAAVAETTSADDRNSPNRLLSLLA